MQGVGVASLSSQEQCAKTGQVVIRNQRTLRILLFYGTKCGWCSEHTGNVVLGNDPPEGTCIRRSDRLTLEQDRGIPVKQGCVHDVGMADDPAYVRRGPVHLARIDAVNIFHRPV